MYLFCLQEVTQKSFVGEKKIARVRFLGTAVLRAPLVGTITLIAPPAGQKALPLVELKVLLIPPFHTELQTPPPTQTASQTAYRVPGNSRLLKTGVLPHARIEVLPPIGR